MTQETQSHTKQDTPPTVAPQSVLTIHLRNIPLLAGLESKMLAQIGAALQVRNLARSDYAVHKGSAGDYLIFLLTGRLQSIDVTEDGREIGLSFLNPGDYFGELSIIDGLPRSASVQACENSLIALLPRAHAQALIYHNPIVARRVLTRMAASIRKSSAFRLILVLPNAFHRVYALLLELAQRSPGGITVIEHLPTQQEIAIMANTSRETVSRAMQALLQQGAIEKDMRRLIIRKPDFLRQELSGDEKRSALGGGRT